MGLGYADLWVLLLAVLLDLAGRELPTPLHPTVWIGKTVALADRISPKGRVGGLMAGGLIALLIPGLWAAAAYFAVQGLHEIHTVAYVLVGAVWLKSTFSVRMLHQVAAGIRDRLLRGDVEGVRGQMRSLVSRNVSSLTGEQMTAATVESVAENTTDSFVAPWLAFALFGLPGAVAYRAVNTLDSMIGYHGKYEYLGKASARLDDLLNLIPARLSALFLLAGSALLPGQRLAGAWRIMRRDHGRTESPNAGWTMSGMAGALGVELEKVGHYRLGDATRPLEPQDITRAVQTMYWIAALGLLIALGLLYGRYGLF
ncbi:MAG: cobalamin biosynthesis protein CobD [SAR202 cluster bacterium]|nr:cobalamin biosynthesis protein CobD [SAR202 cluster bacterium]